MKFIPTVLLSLFAAASAHGAGIEPLRAVAKRGGAIDPGKYVCRQQYNAAGYTEKVVEIVNATSYVYHASKAYPGSMKYDAKTGLMQFGSGMLEGTFEAVFGRRDNGYPIFILIDKDLAPKADAYDLCVRRSEK